MPPDNESTRMRSVKPILAGKKSKSVRGKSVMIIETHPFVASKWIPQITSQSFAHSALYSTDLNTQLM